MNTQGGLDSVKNAKIDFFLFDLEDDEVRTSDFNDARSYEWSPTACNFHSNMPCKFGTMEKKWSILNGSSEKSLKDGGPDYPAIGFWSETYDSATLFSDPITCFERDTRSIRLKLWVKGRWSFEICFLSADDGSVIGCGTTASSTNFQIHRLELEQPFLDYIGDARKGRGPMIIVMYAVVDNGVVLLDDISFTGAPCLYTEEAPIDWIDFKTFSTKEDQLFNELLAPIVKRNFRRYLKTIMSQHGSNLKNKNDCGHVCSKVPCPSANPLPTTFCYAGEDHIERVCIINFDALRHHIQSRFSTSRNIPQNYSPCAV
uniref:Uncharacterized protein n=1 Tax=Romanomermis culicivorax TaxID=13658 RepID=A0A915IBR2_ROMCU